MLAKVPSKIKANSTFKNLIDYICRENKRDKFNDVITTDRLGNTKPIFAEIRRNLIEASSNFQAIENLDGVASGRVGINLRNIREINRTSILRYEKSNIATEQGVKLENDNINEINRRYFTAIRNNLGTANSNIRNLPKLDRTFIERARANRAKSTRAFNASSWANRESIDEFGEFRSREIINGISVEYNTLSYETASDEMKSVALQNVRIKDPVYHLIISWQSDQEVSDSIMFESVHHAIKSIGMKGHQYVCAIHRDTNNPHVHLAVNRVHPETSKAVSTSYDYYKLDYAMRELELKFGFPHDKGVFQVNEDQEIKWKKKQKKSSNEPTGSKRLEAHTNNESFFNYLKSNVLNDLKKELERNRKLNWQDIHEITEKYSVVLKPHGMGLIFECTKTNNKVKASSVHKNLSKNFLENLLGEYMGRKETNIKKEKDSYTKERYRTKNPEEREERKKQREILRKELYQKYDEYKKDKTILSVTKVEIREQFLNLSRNHQRLRSEVKNVNNFEKRKALYSVLAFNNLKDKEKLKSEIERKKLLVKLQKQQTLSFRGWVEREAEKGDIAAISQLRGWRYKERQKNKKENGLMCGKKNTFLFFENSDYKKRVLKDSTVEYLKNGKVAFTDIGYQLLVSKEFKFDHKVIEDLLLFAHQRFSNSFELTGSENFKNKVMREHNINGIRSVTKNKI